MIPHQVRSDRGEQCLTAMPHCHEPGGAIQGGAVVVACAGLGLARVQPHAHAHSLGVQLIPLCREQCLLGGQGGCHAVQTRLKDRVESISSGLDDVPAMPFDGCPNQVVVA